MLAIIAPTPSPVSDAMFLILGGILIPLIILNWMSFRHKDTCTLSKIVLAVMPFLVAWYILLLFKAYYIFMFGGIGIIVFLLALIALPAYPITALIVVFRRRCCNAWTRIVIIFNIFIWIFLFVALYIARQHMGSK